MITREKYVTIAAAEVSDDYGVTLRTRKRKTHLTVDEAEAFAAEVADVVARARQARIDDEAAWGRLASDVPWRLADEAHAAAHGVDVAPMCKECEDGHHGACNGQAVIEVRGEIEHHACGCSEVDHQVHGRAS